MFNSQSSCGGSTSIFWVGADLGWRQFGSALLLLVGIGIAFSGLTGCTASIQGAPDRIYTVADDTAQLRRIKDTDWYFRYANSVGAGQDQVRNQIVFSRMYAIDLAYSQYELALTRERQNVGFWATIANLGVTTSGTLLGGEETKTILHAAATGLTGAKEAYDKNILIDRTIATLQQQMRAQRQIIKVKLVERLRLPSSTYPLEFALSDVEEYYRAGTITGALIETSQDAGARLAAADAEERRVISSTYGKTELTDKLYAFYMSSPQNAHKVALWLRNNRIRLVPIQFIYSDDRVNQQRLSDHLDQQ